MKHTFAVAILLLLASIELYGQHPATFQPGYNPTVPRLIMMKHKVVSVAEKPEILTIQDFEKKIDKEFISLYAAYEMDSTIWKDNSESRLFFPPAKLMDLYLVYDYNYKIYASSINEVNHKIPKIRLASGSYLQEIVVTVFNNEKGKLKSKNVKKKFIQSTINEGYLFVQIDQKQIISNAFVEVTIKLKSRDFEILEPSISSNQTFDKKLSIGMPAILTYDLLTNNKEYELVQETASSFELLNFLRDPGVGAIKKFKVDSKNYSWKVLRRDDGETSQGFGLQEVSIPLSVDIGITVSDILKVN